MRPRYHAFNPERRKPPITRGILIARIPGSNPARARAERTARNGSDTRGGTHEGHPVCGTSRRFHERGSHSSVGHRDDSTGGIGESPRGQDYPRIVWGLYTKLPCGRVCRACLHDASGRWRRPAGVPGLPRIGAPGRAERASRPARHGLGRATRLLTDRPRGNFVYKPPSKRGPAPRSSSATRSPGSSSRSCSWRCSRGELPRRIRMALVIVIGNGRARSVAVDSLTYAHPHPGSPPCWLSGCPTM